MKNLSDDELIAEIRSGNNRDDRSTAFDELYKRYYEYVFRTCVKKIGNVHDAEDLTQDIFIKIIEKLPNYESRGKFRGWVNTVLEYTVIDLYRRRTRRHPQISLDDEEQERVLRSKVVEQSSRSSPEKIFEGKELLAMIHTAIDKIRNLKYSEAVKMRLLNEMTTKNIAKILGCSENAVKIRVHRGYVELREIINRDG